MSYSTRPPITAKFLDSNDNIHDILDYVGALATIDSRRKAIHEGRAYSMDFYDSIAAGNVFTFLGKNTGNKYIHLDEIYMNSGTFLIEFITDGTFTLGGNAYALQAIDGTNDIPSFNLNKGSSNTATFKIYAQPAGLVRTAGTIFAREYNQSTQNADNQWIIAPGQSFAAQFKNVGTSPQQYFLRLRWSEVEK